MSDAFRLRGVIGAFAIVVFAVAAPAGPVVLDAAFTPTTTDVQPAVANTTFTPLADGRVLATGPFTHLNTVAAPGVGMLTASGATDTGFLPSGAPFSSTHYTFHTVAPLRNGRYLAGVGVATTGSNGESYHEGIARLLSDGTLDLNYPLKNYLVSGGGRFVPLSENRVLLVEGSGPYIFDGPVFPQPYRVRLTRFDADGNVDATFSVAPPDTSYTLEPERLAVVPGGGLIVVRQTQENDRLVRLLPSGAVDPSFQPTEHFVSVGCLAVQSDGRVLAASRYDVRFRRYLTSGAVDGSFAPEFPGVLAVEKIRALPGDRIAVEARVATVQDTSVFILDSTGKTMVDLRKDLGSERTLRLMAAYPDGRLLIISHVHRRRPDESGRLSDTANYEYQLLRVKSDGSIDLEFNPSLTTRNAGHMELMQVDTLGRLWIGGRFSELDGLPRAGLARFLPDGSLDRGFMVDVRDTLSRSLKLLQPDGRAIIRETTPGPIGSLGFLTENLRTVRLSQDGSQDPTFTPDPAAANAEIYDVQPDGGFVAGIYEPATINESNFRLVRFNAQGARIATLSTTFAETYNQYLAGRPILPVQAVKTLVDGRLLIALACRRINGVPVKMVARLLPTGALDPTYQPQIDSLVADERRASTVRFDAVGRAVVTALDGRSNSSIPSTRRLTVDGRLDPSFVIADDERLIAARILPDESLMSDDGRLRWFSNGSRDAAYAMLDLRRDDDGTEPVQRYAVDAQGRIYLYGHFNRVDGQPRAKLARLVPQASEGIVSQPRNVKAVEGESAEFSVGVGDAGNPEITWFFNGQPLAGATRPTLFFPEVTKPQAGVYHAVIAVGGRVYTSAPATLVVTPSTMKLVNFSALTVVSPGAPPPILGFFALPQGGRTVLARAIGGGLPAGMITAPRLSLPRLQAISDGVIKGEDIGGALRPDIVERSATVGAFPVSNPSAPPGGPVPQAGSAVLLDLTRGSYSLVTSSADGGAGVCLVELYDATTTASANDETTFRNFSLRGHLSPNAPALIAGFVVTGNGKARFLIRGAGPALAMFGVKQTIVDPRIQLFSARYQQMVAQNDHWEESDGPAIMAASVGSGAFAFSAGARDSALVVSLSAGAYTAQLTDGGGATGEGLIEVYQLTP